MEMLFAVLGGAVLGLGVRYALPGRGTYGIGLLPGVGALVATVLWAALTWLGWKFDGGWIWVVTLVGAGVVSLVVALLVPRRRRTHDSELLQKLSKA